MSFETEDLELEQIRTPRRSPAHGPSPASALRELVSSTPPAHTPLSSRHGTPRQRGLSPAGQLDDSQDADGAAASSSTSGAGLLRSRVGLVVEASSKMRAAQATREARALREAFERFDEDGSNSIDVDELGNLMRYLGYRMTREDLQNLVSQVATDGRSELTFAETEQLTQMYRAAAQFKLVSVDPAELQARAKLTNDLDGGGNWGDDTVEMMDKSGVRPTGGTIGSLIPTKPSDDPAIGCWEALMLCFATYLWVSAFMVAAFDDGDALGWMDVNIAMHAVVCVFFVADVVVRAKVIIADNTPWRVALLVVDALMALPLDIIAYAIARSSPDSQSAINAMRVILFFKVLKTIPTLGYFTQSGMALVNRRYITLYAYAFPALSVLCTLIRVTQLLSVVWYLTSDKRGQDGAFVEALYFTAYTVTGVGYGTVEPANDAQMLIAAAYCLVAQALIAYVVGSIVNVIAESDVRGDGEHQVVQTLRVAQIAGVGAQLRDDGVNFQDHLVRNKLADAYGDLTANLPRQLRDNITLFVKVRLIANDSVFSLAHRATQVALAQVLESAIYRPGESLFLAGDTIHDMLFIAHGSVQLVDRDGVTTAVHSMGSHLGEGALLFGAEEALETARCLTHCEVFVLRRKAFKDIRAKFPVFDIEMNRISQFITEKFAEQQELLEQEAWEAQEATAAEAAATRSVVVDPAAEGGEEPPNGDADGDAASVPASIGNDEGAPGSGRRNVFTIVGPANGGSGSDENDDDGAASAEPDSPRVPVPPIRRRSSPPPPMPPAALSASPSGAKPTPKKTVDFHFRTTTGAVVDLNRISATFRVAAANTAAAASFRMASMRTPSPQSKSPLNREERLAALATDSIFGRLEGGDGAADVVEEDGAADDDSGDSMGNASEASASSSSLDASTKEDRLIAECEKELTLIEALITRLSTRPSGSLLSAATEGHGSRRTPSAHTSPRGSGRTIPQPTFDLVALADPSDVFEREEGEASGATRCE